MKTVTIYEKGDKVFFLNEESIIEILEGTIIQDNSEDFSYVQISYKNNTTSNTQWCKRRVELVFANKLDAIDAAIKANKAKEEKLKQHLHDLQNYIQNLEYPDNCSIKL